MFDINNITSKENEGDNRIKIFRENPDIPVIIFTTGFVAQWTYKTLTKCGVKVTCFADNSAKKIGKKLFDLDIVSFDYLNEHYSNAYVLIATRIYQKEILRQFSEVNFPRENLICTDFVFYDPEFNVLKCINENIELYKSAYNLFEDDISREVFLGRLNFQKTLDPTYLDKIRDSNTMYFDQNIIKLSRNEVFVDCGGFTGDTYEEFVKIAGDFKTYYLCEPDSMNLDKARDKFKDNEKIKFISKGLWNKNDILSFAAIENSGSCIDAENGTHRIEVTTVDELTAGDYPTFIKMDIEGAEKEALMGSEQTIKKHKPKLAICVYHKPMDLIELPLLINELNPSYKLYLRHYGLSGTDTVCYAI